jgi:conjugation transfer TcpE-like protein
VSDDDVDVGIVCATYTHARRHPMVIGKIGGWTPPFQLTLTQVGILLATYLVEIKTWQVWGAALPRGLTIAVALVVPCVLAWMARRARIEGRSLPRAVVGIGRLLFAPRAGRLRGRSYRPARPGSPGRHPVVVQAGSGRP